jgi:hypothetical protein
LAGRFRGHIPLDAITVPEVIFPRPVSDLLLLDGQAPLGGRAYNLSKIVQNGGARQ